jgi:hypothetical protein
MVVDRATSGVLLSMLLTALGQIRRFRSSVHRCPERSGHGGTEHESVRCRLAPFAG